MPPLDEKRLRRNLSPHSTNLAFHPERGETEERLDTQHWASYMMMMLMMIFKYDQSIDFWLKVKKYIYLFFHFFSSFCFKTHFSLFCQRALWSSIDRLTETLLLDESKNFLLLKFFTSSSSWRACRTREIFNIQQQWTLMMDSILSLS